MLGVGALEGDLVGLAVGRPQRALVEVAGVVLPVLVGLSSRASSRAFCSSAQMCSMHLTTAVPLVDELAPRSR